MVEVLVRELRITAESATGYGQGGFALRGRLVNFLDGFLPRVLTPDLGGLEVTGALR